MVGIVDPPRAEAKAAIAKCHDAGIRVRMITGDHATTAAAIAGELGIEGRAITGAQFSAMSDDQLLEELPEIGVIARVAPEDKVRLVRMLQQSQNVVAMTGDGVNDAPALKAADIGVAMGITGTEVSKEAAVMILTDDNFATIVGAVEYGRALYDNLLKYLRFQMSTLVAYIAVFIGAGIFAIAGGIPLNPLQILWLNMVIDIPHCHRPRLRPAHPRSDATSSTAGGCSGPLLARLGPTMRAGLCHDALAPSLVYLLAEPEYGAAVASTMLLTTLSLFHLVAGYMARDPENTIFDRAALPGATQLRRYGFALLAIILVTTLGFLQRIFSTVELGFNQWAICAGIALSLLVVEELIKLSMRGRAAAPEKATAQPATAV